MLEVLELPQTMLGQPRYSTFAIGSKHAFLSSPPPPCANAVCARSSRSTIPSFGFYRLVDGMARGFSMFAAPSHPPYRSGHFLCLVTSSPTLFFQSLCRTVHVLHHTIELQFWSNRRGGSAPPHTPCKTSLSNDIEHNLTHSVPATIADDACFFEEFGAPGMGFGDPKSLRIDACSNSHSHDLFCIWRESGCS